VPFDGKKKWATLIKTEVPIKRSYAGWSCKD